MDNKQQVNPAQCLMLQPDEVVLVRKVLQLVNTLYTVAESDYRENKIDALLRKLRESEAGHDR